MKKIFALMGSAFVYFSMASIIALLAATASLWFKGALDQGRIYRVLAALHGIDVVTMQQNIVSQAAETDVEQPSYEDRLEALALNNLDLDLRESAIENAWQDMNRLQTEVAKDRSRFEEMKDSYDAKLQQLADEEAATSLLELQRTLEAMKPDQAKQQIMKIIQDQGGMDDVVTIFKKMSLDKRKKLIAEFKQGTDCQVLYDILNNIRLGEPMASQTKKTQEELNSFNGN